MNIKAIFYDLDGTLRLNNPSGLTAFANQASALGLRLEAADILRAARWEHYYFAESPELVSDRDTYTDDSNAFWLNYGSRQLKILGASPEQAQALSPQLSAYMREHYRPEDIILDEVYSTLSALRERGYKVGVMSNRFEPYTDYLRERGLADLFDWIIHAGEAGIRKPNPEVFHFMLQRADLPASEALYVGDNYFADVVGARRAGLGAVLYDRAGLFEQPDCPVITTHDQIFSLLNGREPCL